MATDAENQAAAEEAIINGLARPKRIRSRDGEEIEERTAKDAIDAATYFKGRQAAGNPFLLHQRLIPGASR